ncbi:hsp70/Hsp90 co-chaperone Cns1p [Trichomonascus vanleenenianus]|uniref:hsp70/Hsp90 co-chaperone Cns1p n=1 Tax=Trichomonascus vanleenenianus TaxID=2268995 RepID=UPI003ECA6B13
MSDEINMPDDAAIEKMVQSEWERLKYRPGPGEPDLPPQLRYIKDQTPEQYAEELKKMPFFMTQLDKDSEGNEMLEALQALQYEGEPHEVAENFKAQGNEAYRERKFKDAIEFYNKGIEVKCDRDDINGALYLNRAACNLELKNYRKCINDCKIALKYTPDNVKALFRAARAYFAVDRVQESLDCINYGLTIDSNSPSLKELQKKVQEREKKLIELEEKRKAAEEIKQTKKLNLDLAIQSRNITMMYTSERPESYSHSTEQMKIALDDALDPTSALLIPCLFLYPLELESDIITADADGATINDNLQTIFGEDPEWFAKSSNAKKDYALANLQVFAQTQSGGLAKIPKNSTIRKVLSMEKPVIPVIDNFARFYVVPKNRAQEFLGTWNKEHAAGQLRTTE